MATQVAIIGAGPAGLLLGRSLANLGIATVILEQRSRAYVLSRIRAGVLEDLSRAVLNRAGVGARMEAEGLPHAGVEIRFDDVAARFDFRALVGREVMAVSYTHLTLPTILRV